MKSRRKLHKGRQILYSVKDIKVQRITIQQPTDIKFPFYNIKGCNSAMWPFLFYGSCLIWQPSRPWWKSDSIFLIVFFCVWSYCSVLWEFQCDGEWSLEQKIYWTEHGSSYFGSHGDHVIWKRHGTKKEFRGAIKWARHLCVLSFSSAKGGKEMSFHKKPSITLL